MSAERVKNLLIDDGWTKIYGTTEWSVVVSGGVRSVYEKNEIQVHLGLNVKDYPASLIYPRPRAKDKNGIYKGTDPYSFDGEMIGLIQSMTDEEILKELNSEEPFKDYTLWFDSTKYLIQK